tara:strand:+ start:12 stop:221 length:210 start_codon:yes stop_codon:yes gene_type:complete
MGRDQLSSLINAAERNIKLKKDLKECKSKLSIIRTAQKYGFSIKTNDLREDIISERFLNWFQKSEIKPI